MARPNTPHGIEVELRGLQEGQHIENRLHMRSFNEEPDTAELVDLGLSIRNWLFGTLAGNVTDQLSWTSLIIRSLATPSSPVLEYVTGFPVFATHTGGALPNSVTVAAKLLTGFAGRSFRGRIYHMGLTAGHLDSADKNRLGAGAVTNLVAAYNALVTQLIGDTGPVLAVLSERANNAQRAEGIVTAVTAVTMDPVVDSQRRRLPDRGN